MDVARTFSLDSGDKRSKTGPFRAKKWNWNKGLGSMLPARGIRSSRLRQRQICSATCGRPERIAASCVAYQTKGQGIQRGSDMENLENLLLFILSSSSCTLVASVVLLLRPLTAMP
jgi:hypothetical protein